MLSVDRRGRGLRVEHETGGAPSWSADGRSLAVELPSDPYGQPTGIAIVNRAAGETRTYNRYSRPRWAPRGSTLAVMDGFTPTFDLHVLRGDGSRVRRLVRVKSSVGEPHFTWSPDATRLAYVWDLMGSRLALIDVRSARSIRLAAGRIHDVGGFSWSPDGRTIAVPAHSPISLDPSDCLRLVDIRTARVRRLGCPRGLRSSEAAPSWSPDARRIALPIQGGILIFDATHSSVRFIRL